MADLKLYTHPYSRGRIVRWMLEEIGVDYDVEVKEYDGSIKAPDYLAINPMGKVPALTHGDVVVTEVVAICAYLADRFPDEGLAPAPTSAARGPYYRWLFFMAGPFEMATTAKAYGWQIDAENAQVVGCGKIEDSFKALETALHNGPYICGDQFTAADVVIGSYLGWHMMQKTVEEKPIFREYVDRLEARPAAIRANELDDALIEKEKLPA